MQRVTLTEIVKNGIQVAIFLKTKTLSMGLLMEV
jgi:hypothetical protein